MGHPQTMEKTMGHPSSLANDLGITKPRLMTITIGNVLYKNKPIYKVTQESIKKVIREGFDPQNPLNLHVWLTLPNMSVIDLTILPTLAAKGIVKPSMFKNKPVKAWRENSSSDLTYEPILLDNQFMYKVDKIKGYA